MREGLRKQEQTVGVQNKVATSSKKRFKVIPVAHPFLFVGMLAAAGGHESLWKVIVKCCLPCGYTW